MEAESKEARYSRSPARAAWLEGTGPLGIVLLNGELIHPQRETERG